jgi:hypothetical protein
MKWMPVWNRPLGNRENSGRTPTSGEAKTLCAQVATEGGEGIRLWSECSATHGLLGAPTLQAAPAMGVLFESEVFNKS